MLRSLCKVFLQELAENTIEVMSEMESEKKEPNFGALKK